MISGALAAAATPLRDGGAAIDEDGFAPLVGFLAAAGLDGLLALGTTGEGILLSVPERKRVTEIRDAADTLLAANSVAEAYFARSRFIDALKALDEWVKTATLQRL